MDQIGYVTKVDGENIELEVKRISSCGDNCKSCAGSCDVKPHVIILPNKIDAKVGDYVEVNAEAKSILKYMAIIYMIPFAFFIVGIALGNGIFKAMENPNYEILSFFTGMISLVIAFLVVRIIDKNIAKKGNSTISATKVL
jgi:sigma-E factor negative regulatory protein RseC